jgi:hypothetical protein
MVSGSVRVRAKQSSVKGMRSVTAENLADRGQFALFSQTTSKKAPN